MAKIPMSNDTFLLGKVIVDPGQNLLRIGQDKMTLQNKTIQVLVALAETHPRTCSRQQLIDQVWDGNQFSGEKALTNAIYKLRESGLGNIIRTVTKQGYCLDLSPSAISLEPDAVETQMAAAKRTKKRYHLIIICLILLIIIALSYGRPKQIEWPHFSDELHEAGDEESDDSEKPHLEDGRD